MILVPYLLFFVGGPFIFIPLIIVAMSLPRVLALFRGRTPAESRYFECTPLQRIVMSGLYFGLIIGLFVVMGYLRTLMPARAFE